MKILFVNACVRGEGVSRTLELCRLFLEEYSKLNPNHILTEIDLSASTLQNLNSADLIKRDTLIDEDKLDDEMFAHAKEFVSADKILIGAPYWDLTFPTVLRTYIEHVSARNVAFCTTPNGTEGLCKADKLMYITTAGGFVKDNANLGTKYFAELCNFFGIDEFNSVMAEGLDIDTSDLSAIMEKTKQKVIEAVQAF